MVAISDFVDTIFRHQKSVADKSAAAISKTHPTAPSGNSGLASLSRFHNREQLAIGRRCRRPDPQISVVPALFGVSGPTVQRRIDG
jgi:hypothetical protein